MGSTGPGSLRIDPERHLIRDHEIARHLERETGRPFFMYYHRIAKTWVLCCWTQKSSGWCVELHSMKHPAEFTQELCHYFKLMARRKLPTAAEILREAARQERRYDLFRMEQDRECLEAKRFLAKRVAGIHANEPYWQQPGFYVAG